MAPYAPALLPKRPTASLSASFSPTAFTSLPNVKPNIWVVSNSAALAKVTADTKETHRATRSIPHPRMLLLYHWHQADKARKRSQPESSRHCDALLEARQGNKAARLTLPTMLPRLPLRLWHSFTWTCNGQLFGSRAATSACL